MKYARAIFLGAATLMGATTAVAAPVQWTVSNGGNDHWYDIVDSNTTWTAAVTAADVDGNWTSQGFVVEFSEDPMTVVPVPAALPLLLIGLGGLGMMTRRRKA